MTDQVTLPGVRQVKRYGWKPDIPDHRDRVYGMERPTLQAGALPLKFSLRDKMPPVYDQGQLGSCTGNGIAGVLEHAAMAQGEGAVTPSRLAIYYFERLLEGTVNEDSGAQIRDGIKVVASAGAPPETLWPYNESRFKMRPSAAVMVEAAKHEAIQYLRVIPGGRGSPIRTPLSHGFPIVHGFSVPESFEDGSWNPESQALPLPKPGEGVIGGHCVVTVGWDFSLTRFKVPVFEKRNSWAEGWGDEGYFYVDARWDYEPARGLSSDFWIIERVS
jgi:C1A family cysteine protease